MTEDQSRHTRKGAVMHNMSHESWIQTQDLCINSLRHSTTEPRGLPTKITIKTFFCPKLIKY